MSHPPPKLGVMNEIIRQCRSFREGLPAWAEQAGQRLTLEEVRRLGEELGRLKAGLSALECAIASRLAADGATGSEEELRDALRITRRDAKQMTKVAQKLEEMPNARAKLQAGEITLDHVAALAAAAGECGPRRVDGDRGLLEDAAAADPDRFRKRARQWANANSPDRGEEQLKRQRARRKAYAFWDHSKQMGVVHAELDPIRFGQVRQALDLRAEALRRADGGGEVPPDDVRTGDQRRADALFELLTGRDADHLRPMEGMGGKASTRLIITAELGLFDGTNPDGKCEILDTGPVPPSILRLLSPDAHIAGAIFDRSGNPLWLGRSRRLANASQKLVAAIRDRGCVLPCDAPSHQTQLHHVLDWCAGGATDIDNLASLCGAHHRRLQERNLELAKVGGEWRTRPRAGPPVPSRRQHPARAGPAP